MISKKTLLLIFIGMAFLITPPTAIAQVIPVTRTTNWIGNVGVEGGIPDSAKMTTYVTVTPAQGVAGINNALANCPTNQVVQLQAGTYIINAPINITKSSVVLRGMGPGKTILSLSGSAGINIKGTALYDDRAVSSNAPDNVANWTDGLAQGSTKIVLSNTAGLSTGKLLVLDQLNDGNDVDSTNCSNCGRGPSKRSQEQFVKVSAVTGNTVTISSPIYMPNWRASQSPQAWWQNGSVLEKIGIEDLTIDGLNGGLPGDGYGANMFLGSAYNCWIKNIQSLYGGGVCHINPIGTARLEVRHSTFSGGKGTNHMSYGIMFFSTSGSLFEDNIFTGVVAPFVTGGAPSGNAISYNFDINNPYVDDNGNPYQDQFVVTHDAHCSMLLVEGNYGNGFHGDYYHGSMGYSTLLRNRFSGYDRNVGANAWCVYLGPKNRNVNVVGNILGKPNWTTTYSSCGSLQIYGLGCGSQYGFPDDPVVASSVFIHGNYASCSQTVSGCNAVSWDSTVPNHTIPNSLIYNGKPLWFGNRPWPAYDPAKGPATVADSLAHTYIPAGYRYEYGVDPPPDAPGNIPKAPTNLRVTV